MRGEWFGSLVVLAELKELLIQLYLGCLMQDGQVNHREITESGGLGYLVLGWMEWT